MITYQKVVGPDLASRIQRCLAELHDMFITKISPVLRARLICEGTEACTEQPIRIYVFMQMCQQLHHASTHALPGFIIRPPLHIVIVILHLDEPVSQDGCSIIKVVICRHPVAGWETTQTESPWESENMWSSEDAYIKQSLLSATAVLYLWGTRYMDAIFNRRVKFNDTGMQYQRFPTWFDLLAQLTFNGSTSLQPWSPFLQVLSDTTILRYFSALSTSNSSRYYSSHCRLRIYTGVVTILNFLILTRYLKKDW